MRYSEIRICTEDLREGSFRFRAFPVERLKGQLQELIQQLLVHQSHIDLPLCDLRGTPPLNLRPLPLIEPDIAQPELTPLDKRDQDHPTQLANHLILLLHIIGDLLPDFYEDLLGLDKLLGVRVGVEDH